MIGAIIGDIAGSRFEWDNYRAKDFDLLSDKCFFTDDSIMSLAVCDALLKTVPSYKGLPDKPSFHAENRTPLSPERLRRILLPLDLLR